MLLFPQQLPTPGREATIRPVTATPGVWSWPGHLMPRPAAPFVQPWAQHSSRESTLLVQPWTQHSSRESMLLVLPSLLRAGLAGGAGNLQRCQGRRRSRPPSPGRQLHGPVLLNGSTTASEAGPWQGSPCCSQGGTAPGRSQEGEGAGEEQGHCRGAGRRAASLCRPASSSSSSLSAAELLPPLAGRGVGASARPQWLQQQMLGRRRGLLLSPASAPAALSLLSPACPAPLPSIHR